MMKHRIWHKPVLRIDEEEKKERRVTWLELFYDLFFVVIITQLAHKLVGNITFKDIVEYILLFIPVWWVWIGSTFYNERFETAGIETRFFYFLKMLSVASIAIFIHDAIGKDSKFFALSYAAARGIITFLWLRATIHVKAFRKTGTIFVIGFSLSILLFIISIFIPTPYRFFLWAIGLFIDLLTPTFTLSHQAKLPRFSTSKLPERFGLLIIIVLGESIVGVVNGIAGHHDVSLESVLIGLLGITLVFLLWWVYFDFVAKRYAKPSPFVGFFWNYLHLPLVLGIAAIGAAITNTIIHKGPYWLLPGATGFTLVIIGFLEITLKQEKKNKKNTIATLLLKILSGFSIFIIFIITGIKNVIIQYIILIFFILLQVVYDIVINSRLIKK